MSGGDVLKRSSAGAFVWQGSKDGFAVVTHYVDAQRAVFVNSQFAAQKMQTNLRSKGVGATVFTFTEFEEWIAKGHPSDPIKIQLVREAAALPSDQRHRIGSNQKALE